MFGLSLATELFQGSTERTWNCVSNFVHLVWNKLSHKKHSIMPRSRKRHHSHSRSRSRSHSHERNREEKNRRVESNDQDGKRRKIEGYDSPHQKRSVSAEPKEVENVLDTRKAEDVVEILSDSENDESQVEDMDTLTISQEEEKDRAEKNKSSSSEDSKSVSSKLEQKLNITPSKVLSPKQKQKRLESEKKRVERQQEKEEKERLRNEEKEKIKQEKLKQKQEKDDQKKKEREVKEAERLKKIKEKEEQKKKENEEREQKKREKEEKEEQKRKEKEQEKIKKQQEMEEKNKEKNKQQEVKQKTAAAFVNFFVAKKSDGISTSKKSEENEISTYFKPFEVKSDMKLPLERREPLGEFCKDYLVEVMEKQDKSKSYLKDLKSGKKLGKCEKTWPYEEETDVVIIEEETNLGETIYEDKTKVKTLRAKYLKFHENRRPAYHGTWKKKSQFVSGRRPFGKDKKVFDYEVDSDEDWEEEEQGESIENGSDDEKENEPEEDYEVDNEFFVPHGHLSDDEIDDEETSKLSPEDLKQKLKLLKDEFDQDMQSKTQKLKPRSIGCVWYNKDGTCAEEAIDRYLKPLAIISQGQIIIKKRSEIFIQASGKKKQFVLQELDPQIITMFLKLIHGNTNKKRVLVEQFLTHIANQNHSFEVGKGSLYKYLNLFANWKKCTEDGPLKNKHCWIVGDDIQKKYKVALAVADKSEN